MRRPYWSLRIPLIALFAALTVSPVFAGSLDLPTVEISASSITFGNQVVDSRSQPKSLLVLNRGNKALTISKISASGDFAAESDCGATLEAGHGCTIVTTYSPSLVGDADGKLTITDDSNSSPHVVILTGTGVLPLTITPAALEFQPRTVGTSQTAPVMLTNNRREAIQLQISSTADLTPSSTCRGEIAAGKSCEVRIAFTPTQARQVRGKVTFSYGTGTQTLIVTGTAVSTAPQTTGLQVQAPRIPAVTALAPVIPPTPVVSAALPYERRGAIEVAQKPGVISPPPNVSGVLPPSSVRHSGQTTTAVVPPPPRTEGRLSSRATKPLVNGTASVVAPPPNLSSVPARSPQKDHGATAAVIPPPPRTAGQLSSGGAKPLVSGTPDVIAPPPSTNKLAMTAKPAPSTAAMAPAPPPTPAVRVSQKTLVIPSGMEAKEPAATSLEASAKAPADARAVSQTPVTDSATPVAAIPRPDPSPRTAAVQPVNQPAVIAASIPPPNTRAAANGGVRVRLIVGLKGTAAGTVTSSAGAINCGNVCQDSFASGQKVVLMPQAPPNSSFAGWRGCDSVAGTNCTVVMDREKSVTAIFVKHYDDLSPE